MTNADFHRSDSQAKPASSIAIGAEKDDKRLARRYEAILAAAGEGIYGLDCEGRLTFANPAAARMIGWSADELIGKFMHEVVHHSDAEGTPYPREECPIYATLSDGSVHRREGETFWRRDGSSFTVRYTSTPVFEDDKPTGAVVTFEDITERKRDQRKLRESEERFKSAFEYASTGMALVSLDNRYRSVNRALCRMLGYREEELLGRSSFDLTHPDDLDEGRERTRRMLESGGPPTMSLEKRYVRKDGGTAWAISDVSLVRDAGGRPSHFVSQFQDITPRKNAEEALERERNLMHTVINSARDAIFVKDTEHRFVLDNRAHREILGAQSQEEILGKTNADIWGPDRAAPHHADDRQVMDTGESLVGREERVQDALGKELWLSTTKVPLSPDDSVEGLVAISRDITTRRQAEEALKESQQRLQAVTEGAPVILFALDTDGIFTFETGAGLTYAGMVPGRNIGRSVFEAFFDFPEMHDNIRRVLAGEEVAATLELAGRAYHANYSPLRGAKGEVSGVIGVATDITERQRLQDKLAYQALHDPLTDLPNRTLFEERLTISLSCTGEHRKTTASEGGRVDARQDETGDGVSVLFMDLDNFKTINDSLGHSCGDELLVAVAGRLKGCLRPPDCVARLGGDEFAILLAGGGTEEAIQVAERVRARLRTPFSLSGGEGVFVNTSIGIASRSLGGVTRGDQAEPVELLRQADLAMYRAKEEGRVGYAVFEPWMDERAQARLSLERAFRHAVDSLGYSSGDSSGEFVLHYQPKIRLHTGEIVGMEALLRWKHPERGLLLPQEFIGLAKELGLIPPLGRWVLHTACRRARQWREHYPPAKDRPPLRMCVNVSAAQLRDPSLVEDVAEALDENGLPPDALVLEVSEEASTADVPPANDTLRRLKELGVKLALDDFGTGHASLSYLRDLPLDYIKIDRSLVSGTMLKAANRAIVSATITLAHTLNMQVIAEGIESAGEAAELGSLGCDLGQGFYWCMPGPAERVEWILGGGRTMPSNTGSNLQPPL